MSRDYDDDEDRPRRRRPRYEDEEEQEDDRPRRRRGGSGGRSGSVTGVGVVTIVLGALQLLCGICYSIIGLAFGAGAGGGFGGAPNFLPAAIGGLVIVFALIVLIFGGLYLAGGIGVVQRRNWGRIMTLVMAGFSGIFGILCLISAINTMMQPAIVMPAGFPQQNFQQSRAMAIIITLLFMFLAFTHCISSYVVLLSGRNAAEFE